MIVIRKILLSSILLFSAIALHPQSGDRERYADIGLYYLWQEHELRNIAYKESYQRYVADSARINRRIALSPLAKEAEALDAAFTQAFWKEKDYEQAFYIGFRLEELLPTLNENEHPIKRVTYYKLGEAYYLMLDFHKSIQLLENALSPVPISFNDRTNLDALNILGICYANIGQMDTSDNYFKAILLSNDTVLDRSLHNAYALAHLGCNAMLTGQYDKALAISSVAWPVLRNETSDWGHLAGMCYCRGRSHLEKGDYKQASVWIDSLVFFAHRDQYNKNKRIKQAHLLRSDYHTAIGDALQAKIYRDSLISVYKHEEKIYTSGYIAHASQQYNNEKIADREAKLKTSHARLAVISIVALISFAAIGIILSLYRKKNAAYKVLALKASQWAHEESACKDAIEDEKVDEAGDTNGITIKREKEKATEADMKIMMLVEQELAVRHAYRNPQLSMELLAERIGVHRNTLSHAINHTIGQNFNHYVNSFRIKETVRTMLESDNSRLYIGELYENVGFTNRSTFYRAFKQFTGISPFDFQKNKDTKQDFKYF